MRHMQDKRAFETCPTCDGTGEMSHEEYYSHIGNNSLNQMRLEALRDVIRFCEQFPLSEDKKKTLDEYKRWI